MRLRSWTLGLLAAVACVGVAGEVRADDKVPAEARAYFKNGVELLQSEPPNYQDAYYQFKLAYEKSKSWKVLGNLGLCALKLERDGESLGYYDEYLRQGGKQIIKEERESIERDVLLLKGNGATLELSSPTQNVKIQDARTGSTVAPQTYALGAGKASLFLRAGAHHLTATTAEGKSLSWDVSLEPGGSASHDFDFDAPPAAAAAPEKAPEAPAPLAQRVEPAPAPSSGPNVVRTAGFITLGVGALALGSGIITGIMERGKESDFKAKCENKVCDPSAASLKDEAATLATTTNILLIGGGVVAAAGLGMVIFGHPPANSEQPSASAKIVPLVWSHGGGVFASGAF
ncbi:MAG: hypothetical protein QM756_25645 [Polyangiaceae bacterium]